MSSARVSSCRQTRLNRFAERDAETPMKNWTKVVGYHDPEGSPLSLAAIWLPLPDANFNSNVPQWTSNGSVIMRRGLHLAGRYTLRWFPKSASTTTCDTTRWWRTTERIGINGTREIDGSLTRRRRRHCSWRKVSAGWTDPAAK
jgi:hypothetical protein